MSLFQMKTNLFLAIFHIIVPASRRHSNSYIRFNNKKRNEIKVLLSDSELLFYRIISSLFDLPRLSFSKDSNHVGSSVPTTKFLKHRSE